MYVNTTVRPRLDKEIEALARNIAGAARTGSPEYNFAAILAYAIAKVAGRATKIHFGQVDYSSASALEAALNWAKEETVSRVIQPFYDKQRNVNGDVFGELI